MPEPAFEDLHREFERGIAGAGDPTNVAAIHAGGEARTTLSSSWLSDACPVCSHTFRLGDTVLIAADRSVRHDMPDLPCAGGGEPVFRQIPEAAEFFAAMDIAWPPPRETPVRCLVPDDGLVAPPKDGFRRHTCFICAHTLRPGDLVVVCPCSPRAPLCIAAIHRDPVHNLSCLEQWNPSDRQKYCPVTSRSLDD